MKQLNADTNLVVCQKSKIHDWVEHFRQYYSNYTVYDLTNKAELEKFLKSDVFPIIGVINYDLIWRRKELLELNEFTLILDESSLIQNMKAKRTKFILKLKATNVILLSGTVCGGKYENLYSQLHLLGWGIGQDTYERQYVNWTTIDVGGFIHRIVNKDDPYKNVERLKSKMREHGAVFLKTEECFNLPEQTFIQVEVEVTKEYKKFKKDSIVTVNDVELVGDTSLTKMLYMRMLCGQYNTNKLDAFKDLVESTNDRLIVFYNFNEELNQMKKIAEELERPISEVNGHVKDLTAYEQEDDSITFCQYMAAAMGLNLQKANKMIFFTLPLSSELFEQSKKRIHRLGQNQPCFYYTMICKNSIEESIQQTLEMRKNYTDDLFKEEMR